MGFPKWGNAWCGNDRRERARGTGGLLSCFLGFVWLAPSAIIYIYDPALATDGDPPGPTALEDRGCLSALVFPARDYFFQEHVEFPYPACFIPYRQTATPPHQDMSATRPSIFAAQTHWYVVVFRILTNPRLALRAMNFASGEIRKVSIDPCISAWPYIRVTFWIVHVERF